jgi:hypothetical protein
LLSIVCRDTAGFLEIPRGLLVGILQQAVIGPVLPAIVAAFVVPVRESMDSSASITALRCLQACCESEVFADALVAMPDFLPMEATCGREFELTSILGPLLDVSILHTDAPNLAQEVSA